MLDHFWHWRFAQKLSPALQEKRLLYIASGDGSTGNGTEDESEGSLDQPTYAEQAQQPDAAAGSSNVQGISDETAKDITELAPEIAKTVAWSPFVLDQTLEILRDEKLRLPFPNVDFEQMERSIRLHIRELEKGKGDTKLAEGITRDIEFFIHDEVLAAKLAEAFKKRMDHVGQLLEQLGDTPPSDIVALEHKFGLEDKSLTAYTNESAWEESEVDAILKEMKIDPEIKLDKDRDKMNAEEKRAHDALQASVKITDADIGNGHKLTKGYKLRVIQKKVMAARKIAMIERNDLNGESSVGSTKEMERKLFEQMQLAREHALRLLKKNAERLSAEFTKRITPLIARYENQPELVAKELGISVTALHRRLAQVHAPLERAKGTAHSDPENLSETSDEAFSSKSKRLSEDLKALTWIEGDDESFKRELLGTDGADEAQDKQERIAVIAWVTSYASPLTHATQRLNTDAQLRESLTASFGDLGVIKNLAEFATDLKEKGGVPDPNDEEFLYDEFTVRRRRQLELIIAAVESPHVIDLMHKDEQDLKKDTTENTQATREKLNDQLRQIENACFGDGINEAPTHSALSHESVTALGADMMMRSKLKYLSSNLLSVADIGEGKSREMIRECALEIRKFQEVLKQLDALDSFRVVELNDLDAYEQACGTKETTGCYNQGDGKIYLNLNVISNDTSRQQTLHHEQGHAIVDTLMRKTGLLPQLFVGISMYFKQEVPGRNDGTTFEDILFSRAEAWMIKDLYEKLLEQETEKAGKQGYTGDELTSVAKLRADSRYKELLIDELINKFASYKNGKDESAFSPEDIALFTALETGSLPAEKISVSDDFVASSNDVSLQNTSIDGVVGDGGDGDDEGEGRGEGGAEVAKATTENIGSARNNLLKIKNFIGSHGHINGIECIEQRYEIEKSYLEDDIEKPFYATEITEAELEPKLRLLEEDMQEVLDEIDRIKGLELDMSKQGPSGRGGGIIGFIRNMEYISIMDMINTVKQGAEDIQRMWKRRGERVQSKLGKSLTNWIGDWVPYAGQLKHEYEKRGNSSELEEVNQWKEAIKDLDSYRLQTMLGTTRNKDQVRAIAEVLSERGRMDWNYEPFWDTLNALSMYNMPKEPCKGSDILRDKWIQKLITDIWGDKDKYFEWRQQNDGAVDSGKKKFTTTTDQLSNIKDGLAENLERQLQLWINRKSTGGVPEDVNPHLYEEVLEYSMRNGKMTMEEKLYFLVRGVATGLLSIDRLRALAGENGGILSLFPFIDYFYGKNNSMSEIQALAERLTEGGNRKYKPGPKTTLWLHLELTRNESARQRMAKVTSGSRTEELDHEDIPTIVSQMDYKGVEELTGVLSGSRFKMSNEAAKNTYTGFGTKFRILAQLAKLHQQKKAQFTEQDAQEAAKSIAAYAHLDNILTRNGMDEAVRIEVTLDQIASQKAPSTKEHVVKDYRKGNSSLVRNVINGIDLDWIGSIGVDKNTYVRNKDEEDNQTIIDDPTRQKANFAATKKFSRELSRALADPANRDKLIDILAGMANEFKQENYYDEIKEERVEQYLDERRKHGVKAATSAMAL